MAGYTLHRVGPYQKVIDGATSTAAVDIDCRNGHSLLVVHCIGGSPATGGYCSLEVYTGDGLTTVAHDGNGENIKTAATKTSYHCRFNDLTERVKLTCNITDGTHTVWAQVIGG